MLVLVFNRYSLRARQIHALQVECLEPGLGMKDESPALGRSAGPLCRFAGWQPRGLASHSWFHPPVSFAFSSLWSHWRIVGAQKWLLMAYDGREKPGTSFQLLELLLTPHCWPPLPPAGFFFYLCILKKQNSVVRRRKLLIRLCWAWSVRVMSGFWTNGRDGSLSSESMRRPA